MNDMTMQENRLKRFVQSHLIIMSRFVLPGFLELGPVKSNFPPKSMFRWPKTRVDRQVSIQGQWAVGGA